MNKFTTSFLLSVILFVSCKKQEFDLVIRGATVYDGAGNAGVVTDVGIKADTIASLGNLSKAIGKVEVDANGLVLAPGFIDTHSHHGWGLRENPSAEPVVSQGVTNTLRDHVLGTDFKRKSTQAEIEYRLSTRL